MSATGLVAWLLFFLCLWVHVGMAAENWRILVNGEALVPAGPRTAVWMGFLSAVLLWSIYSMASRRQLVWIWRRFPGLAYVVWWVVLASAIAVLPAVYGLRGATAVGFLVLSVVPFVPLNRSNFRYWAYWTGLLWRSFVTYGWAHVWLGYVFRGEWSVSPPGAWLIVLALVAVLMTNFVLVYLLEYRVDWAALQREVEARTGASSASA